MIHIEDLKESLRHQLCTLIALYEDESAAADSLRHGGEGAREAGAARSSAADSGVDDRSDEAAGSPATRGEEIETCLTAFHAAIGAAERAERARGEAQRVAFAAMERSASARAAAAALRQDLQRLLLAAGRSLATPAGDLHARRVDEMRTALHIAEGASRIADREAHQARRRAEIAISAASAALLAAIQADPARGNQALDPAVARAARAVAERAADDAEHNLEEAGAGVVVAVDRAASSRQGAPEPAE